MINNKKILAIIPARGGSKRLPKKNIKQINGRPLIEWSIIASNNSKYIDEVVVSTDSLEIAEISKKAGATVPFIRPNYLASDHSSTFDALEHCIKFYENELNKVFDIIVLLQPTSPLRTANHIDEALLFMDDKKAKSIISVCETEHPPEWSNTLPSDLSMDNFLSKKVLTTRSQDFPQSYRLNGAIYICKTKELLKQKTFFIDHDIYAYPMQKQTSIDIDTIDDFELAEYYFNKRK